MAGNKMYEALPASTWLTNADTEEILPNLELFEQCPD
jgi:hypothetical protein